MRSILIVALLLTSQFIVSQELVSTTNIVKTKSDTKSRKGQFFFAVGWNRDTYSSSDITFAGSDFDFELHNAKADDKRKVFADGYRESSGMSLPDGNQINIKLGYFISDHYNIVLGYDAMKYVLRNGQDGKISGEIAKGTFSYEGAEYNYDGNYGYNDINYSRALVVFEHNSLNYFFVGVNRFDNLNGLFNLNTENFEINLEEGIDLGLAMPKTESKILNNQPFNDFNTTGFGYSANLGINFTFFKYFYLKPEFKFGHINLNDLKITQDTGEKATQKFNFTEKSLSLGVRFNLGAKQKSTVQKKQETQNDDLELSNEANNRIEPTTAQESKLVMVDDSILDTVTCPDIILNYKEKFNEVTDPDKQSEYSWLSLYYKYICECKEGSKNPEDLVPLINNVVDSYLENVKGDHENITKVSKCRPLPEEKK